MVRRRQRSELPPDVARVVEALGVCRRVMVRVMDEVRPFCPAYRAADAILSAIDDLTGLLTGDREHFWAKGSVGPGRADALRARQSEVDSSQIRKP